MIIRLGMANNEIVYVDEASGEPVDVVAGPNNTVEELSDPNAPHSVDRVFDAFWATPEGKQLDARIKVENNWEIFLKIYGKLYGDSRRYTVSRLRAAFLKAEGIREFAEDPAIARARELAAQQARDAASGRFVDRKTQIVQKYEQMISRNCGVQASEVTKWLNSDREAREIIEDYKRQEAGIGEPAPSPLIEENEKYLEFSLAYRRTPSLKPVLGYVTLDYGDGVHKKFPFQDFQAMTDKSIELGVL